MANGKMININNHSYVTDGAMLLRTTTTTINWNEEFRLGVQTTLNITFPTPPSDISAESVVIFIAGENCTATFTPPSGYTIQGLDSISYTLGYTYEIYFKVINSSTISALYVASPSFGRLPEGYREVEYIESTGTQWIDTGFHSQSGMRGVFKFLDKGTGNNSTARIFAGGGTGDENMFDFCNSYSSIQGHTVGTASASTAYKLSTPWTINTIYEMDVSFENQNQKAYVNGTLKASATFNVNKDTGVTLSIFGRHYSNNTMNYSMASQCFYFKLYFNNTLIRDFIPCIREIDGAIGLYDLCGSSSPFDGTPFYGNAGTGVFLAGKSVYQRLPSGYTELEYISSTKTQWIDTGIIFSSGEASINMQVYPLTISTNYLNDYICGAWNGSQRSFALLGTRNPVMVGLGTTSEQVISTMSTSVGTIYNYDLKVVSSPSLSATLKRNNVVWTGSYSGTATTNTKTLYLFTVNYDDNATNTANSAASMRLYYAKIYEGTTLIRDYVPCRRNSDGMIGMIDLCNSASPFDGTPFYGNSGTGVFYPGPIVGLESLIEKHITNVGTNGIASASQYKSGYDGNAYMAFDDNVSTTADVYYGSAYANGTYIQYIWNTAVKYIDYILVSGFIDGAGTITTGAIQYTLDGTNWTTITNLTNANFSNNFASGVSDTGVTNLYKVNLTNVRGIRIGSTASSNSRGMIIKELACYGTK